MIKSVFAKLKQNYQEQSTVKRALWSGTFNALSTFSWYALPDYLPSRKSRSGIKVLLLAGEIAAGWIMGVIPSLQINPKDADKKGGTGLRGACESHQDVEMDKTENTRQGESAEDKNPCGCCDPEITAESKEEDEGSTIPVPVALAFAASMLFLLPLGEKLIFSRGEKRRRAGRRYAHTKQAMWLAIFTGILSAITEAIPESEDELA